MHDPSKQVKRPTAAFSTGNLNQPTQNLASPQTQPSFQQQNQNRGTDTVSSKKSQNTRYGQSISGKQQSQQQNTQRAHLNASIPTQNFSINRKTIPPPEWYEQLQILPVSIVKGSKVFDIYALIHPGSQFTLLLDKFTRLLELPCEAQASTTLQYLNTEHETPLSKISETVTVTPLNGDSETVTKSISKSALQEPIARQVSMFHPLTFLNSFNYATPSRNLVTFISLK